MTLQQVAYFEQLLVVLNYNVDEGESSLSNNYFDIKGKRNSNIICHTHNICQLCKIDHFIYKGPHLRLKLLMNKMLQQKPIFDVLTVWLHNTLFRFALTPLNEKNVFVDTTLCYISTTFLNSLLNIVMIGHAPLTLFSPQEVPNRLNLVFISILQLFSLQSFRS